MCPHSLTKHPVRTAGACVLSAVHSCILVATVRCFQRYIFANWAWISYDGKPRPDHTADEINGRTG